jgi:hypothetical protein
VLTLDRSSEENSLEARGIRMWVIQPIRLRGQNGAVIWHRLVHKGRALVRQLLHDQKRHSFSFIFTDLNPNETDHNLRLLLVIPS